MNVMGAPPVPGGRFMLQAPPPYPSLAIQDQGASAASAQSGGFSDGGWHSISTDSTSSDLPQGNMWPNYPPPLPAAFPGNAMAPQAGSPKPASAPQGFAAQQMADSSTPPQPQLQQVQQPSFSYPVQQQQQQQIQQMQQQPPQYSMHQHFVQQQQQHPQQQQQQQQPQQQQQAPQQMMAAQQLPPMQYQQAQVAQQQQQPQHPHHHHQQQQAQQQAPPQQQQAQQQQMPPQMQQMQPSPAYNGGMQQQVGAGGFSAPIQPVGATPQAGPDGSVDARYICRHFQKSRCTWGSDCRFYHPGVSKPMGAQGGASAGISPGAGKGTPPQQPLGAKLPQRAANVGPMGEMMHDFQQMSVTAPPGQQQQQQQQQPPPHPMMHQQGQSFAGQIYYQQQAQQQQRQAMPQEGNNMLLKYSPIPGGMSAEAHAHQHQLALINDRNPIVKAAVAQNYDMTVTNEGYDFAIRGRHGQTYIIDKLLEREALAAALNEADVKSPDVRSGGLAGLFSDEILFWSVITSWHRFNTTYTQKWDEILKRAMVDDFDCPFTMHCKIPFCRDKHPNDMNKQQQQQQQIPK